ncbi:MAG TPA: hypothetical protein V6D03_00270, partial [Candidatus Caenarcaniphilales bacterium]
NNQESGATVSDTNAKASLSTILWNALTLDAHFYENARNTLRNRRLARTVVLLAACSHVLGSAVILLINRATLPMLMLALLIDVASVVGGYYFWTLTIWKLGQWLRSTVPSYEELLSPIGFAYAPQALNFLTLIPLLGRAIELVLAVWSLLAVIVAVRQGLDLSTRGSAILCLGGWPLVQVGLACIKVLEQLLIKITT